MNEKLEKEIKEWDLSGPHTCYPWTSIPDAIKITARHFYNLALQDVKIELERFIREECCPGYSGINVCRDMIKFIDKLTE